MTLIYFESVEIPIFLSHTFLIGPLPFICNLLHPNSPTIYTMTFLEDRYIFRYLPKNT